MNNLYKKTIYWGGIDSTASSILGVGVVGGWECLFSIANILKFRHKCVFLCKILKNNTFSIHPSMSMLSIDTMRTYGTTKCLPIQYV
jgi:hypothetical protein